MANTRIVGFGPFRFWWERKWDLDADAQAEKEMRFVYGRRGLPSPRAHAASDESSQSTSQACYLKKIPTGLAISQILDAAAANYDILDFNPKLPVAVVIRSRRSDASGEYKIAGEDAGAAEIIVRMLPPNMAKVKVHAVAFDDDDKLPFSLPEANLI